MEKVKTLLIANRGEIAVRIARTAGKLGVRTIAVYTTADAASSHVAVVDKAVLLRGADSKAYLDGDQIINIAKEHQANAIIPGYGFLSENAEFAKQVMDAGMVFVGPSPACIEDFGIKHTARELARQANVPIVPGTKGLVRSEDEAVEEARKLTFPVMLKATAGGGGMGLLTCHNEDEVRKSFKTVQSRGESLFKNAGLFIEKYYPSSHHIEVQIFGNGQGKAIHFGERECSMQRRHQKVIEECPSPFVTKHPSLREKLGSAAVRLAESIRYGSAGTVEYLVDDESGDFFFLEMNTRLQVEHGITELCYSVDLVELMLRQADAEIQGKGGLDAHYLAQLQPAAPIGAAIEARIYAENPAKDYAPSPGILQEVSWKTVEGSRIDTWIHRGTTVTSHYDPLLAKVMVHAPNRENAIEKLRDLLTESRIYGPPTNMDFLATILGDPTFKSGRTMTKFLESFKYKPAAIDVLEGGSYTLIEDWPGRPTIGRGFSHSGAMDPLAFRMANMLVGNSPGTEGIEITLSGPDLRFLSAAMVALTGAPIQAKLDGKQFPMWTRIRIKAGQRLTIGKTTENGCRSYLAIYGGLPTIATWFQSKSTAPMTAVGGYQGRSLKAGDFLGIVESIPELSTELKIPSHLIPVYPSEWQLYALPGPYDEGFLTNDFIETMYKTAWKVSHNAARGGIRLIGPRPKWARSDGGEGGSHPSNVIEYGYPVGAINWTGDDPCLFPVDAPDFGGFISALTIIKADFWKMGQLKAGDKVHIHRTTYDAAVQRRKTLEDYLSKIQEACKGTILFSDIEMPDFNDPRKPDTQDSIPSKAIVHQLHESNTQPLTTYRQGGDDYLLIEYGHGSFDLNYRCRAVALHKKLLESKDPLVTLSGSGALHVDMPCGNSLMLYYDSTRLTQKKLLDSLIHFESLLGDLSQSKFPSRKFKLPITFTAQSQTASLQRYIETQRPYASYLPEPLDFVAQNNAISIRELKDIFTKSTLMVVAVGFFVALPIALPIDPRQRIQCPKMNPSRVHTPEGQVGWGGSCMALYNVESPGGYMNTGLSIPGADILGFKDGYSADRPWLFDDFDQITFYEVSESEYDGLMATFRSGRYVYEYEDTVFDMKEHNDLLARTESEVAQIRDRQSQARADMARLENELLDKWHRERDAGKVSTDTVEELLNDPSIHAIVSPVTANVWKLLVREGDIIPAPDHHVSILEAMKLEIPVPAGDDGVGATVEKLLVQPGDVVDAGATLLLLRVKSEDGDVGSDGKGDVQMERGVDGEDDEGEGREKDREKKRVGSKRGKRGITEEGLERRRSLRKRH